LVRRTLNLHAPRPPVLPLSARPRIHPEKFTRQKPLGRYIADFYCARARLVIELDGDSHFTDRGERYDETRSAELALSGIRVLRLTNLEVMTEFEGACARIDQALDR
jgi:very-short-patch-repair endonuclease